MILAQAAMAALSPRLVDSPADAPKKQHFCWDATPGFVHNDKCNRYPADEELDAYKIIVVMEPLFIDEDYYAHVEGHEIISNLAKAAGLAHITM